MFLNFFNLKTTLEKVVYLFSQDLSLLKYRKILLNIFKAYLGLAPSYIAEMWNPYEHICSLSSSAGILLAFRNSLPNFKGDRAFAIRARKPERNWLSRSGSLKFVFSLLSLSCPVC